MDYMAMVKMLTNAADEQEPVIQFLVDSVIQSILSYCNIRELPEELDYIVVRMTADMFNEQINMLKMMADKGKSVKSVSEGGRTVSLGADTDIAKFFAGLTSERITRMKELDKFKQLYLI